MRLEIFVDEMRYTIDTTNPELLSRWIMEVFGRVMVNGWTPATYVRVQAYPSYVPSNDGSYKQDWIADTRYLDLITDVKTPRELVNALSAELAKYENDAEKT